MRLHRLRWTGTLAALLLLVTVGCGDVANTDYGYGPIVVTSVTPTSVSGLTPVPLTITGSDFSTIIGDGTQDAPVPECTVTFMAVSPAGATPFLGGTSDRVDLRGTILSRTQISVMSPKAVICGVGAIEIRLKVTLPSGVFAYSGNNAFTFVPPTLGAFVGGSSFPAAIPTTFQISPALGTDFGAPGSTVTLFWEKAAPADQPLFGGSVAGPAGFPQIGTADDITTLGAVNALGNLEGLTPIAVVCEPGNDTNRPAVLAGVNFPDGSCTPPGNTLSLDFRPPRVTGILNTSGVLPEQGHDGLAEFAAAIPESFDLAGTDFGPDGGLANVVFTATMNIFESSLPGGGLTNTATVPCYIASPSLIQGLCPPAAVCGVATDTVEVTAVLDTGSCTPVSTASTFFAPVYEEIINLDRADPTAPANPATTFVAAIQERFRIESPVNAVAPEGGDFGPDGGTALVTFTSADGNPIFQDNQDGSAPSTDLQPEVVVSATVVDRDTIEGVSPEALICADDPTTSDDVTNPTPLSISSSELIDIDVLLEGGSCIEQVMDATEIFGPTIDAMQIVWTSPYGLLGAGDLDPAAFPAAAPIAVPSTLPLAVSELGEFKIVGTHFATDATACTVTFTAAAGLTPFPGQGGVANSQTLDVSAIVVNETTIVGYLPTLDDPRLQEDILLSVTVTLDSNGSCASYQDLLHFVAPPTIDTIARVDPTGVADANAGFYTEYNLPSAVPMDNAWPGRVDFLGSMSSQMRIEGWGFVTGPVVLDDITWTVIFDKNQGVDPITKVPLRRLGENPPTKELMPYLDPDIGSFPPDADFLYAVDVDFNGGGDPRDGIDGFTRYDEWLAGLDTDRDGHVTFVVRVINPDGQFHEVDLRYWRTASGENKRTYTGSNANLNVDVTIDPSSAPKAVNNDFAVVPSATTTNPEAVDGLNMVVVSSNEVDVANSFNPFATGIMISFTRDGGKTWQAGGAVDEGSTDADPLRSFPMARFDDYGNLWLSYRLDEPSIDYDPVNLPFAGQTRIMLALSTDQGATWSSYFELEKNAFANLDRPYLEVGDMDTASVAWVAHLLDEQNNFANLRDEVHARSVQIADWNGATTVYPAAGPDVVNQNYIGFFTAQDARCAVGPSGELYVSWVEVFIDQVGNIFAYIDWNVDRDGLASATFGWEWSSDRNLTFVGSPFGTPSQPFFPGVVGHDIAVAQQGTHAGRAVFTYENFTPMPPWGSGTNFKKEVVVQHTDDYGVIMSNPITVHQTNNGDQFLPVIFSDRATGTLYITWYDSVSDTSSGNDDAERFSAASADGSAWGDAFKLPRPRTDSDANFSVFGFGDVGGGVAAFNNTVLAGWGDNGDWWSITADADMDAFVRIYQQTTESSP